jgi:UDP-N-acetyl-D-galactosamine dehydrogenase
VAHNKILGVIGLGYVGLPLAVEFAKKRKVVGYDIKKNRISDLNNFKDATLECSEDELRKATNITFTNNEEDLSQCSIFIITVPTPIDEAKRPDLRPLMEASRLVSKYLKKDDLVIYESTVYPGATEEVCIPILEEGSNFKINKDFYCGYSPERINPGDKINTISKIIKITSGSNPKASEMVDILYSEIIDAGTFCATSIKVAEAAKVIENSQRDLNIAFVNELSVIFERMNIDTDEVLNAASTKWNFLKFKPGIVGGHCIGVDPYYLTFKAQQLDYNPQVILAGRRMNDNMGRYIARNIIKKMMVNNINASKATVGIMGITFKENCPDIRNSKVVDIISELRNWGVSVKIEDPWASGYEVKSSFNYELMNKIDNVDCLIVAVAHSQFKELTPNQLKQRYSKDIKNFIIGDIKSIYNKDLLINSGFKIFRL